MSQSGIARFPMLALLVLSGLSLPGPLAAQRASSMLAHVETDGRATADVAFDVYADGTRRHVATTGSSGLAVIEFSRAPLAEGTRLLIFALTCDGRTRIALARSASALPPPNGDCRRARLGSVTWARTERLDVVLGENPRASSRLARDVVAARAGFRVQVGPLASFVGGDFENVGTGFGGELLGGYDASSGAGIGAGLALARHSLDGVDEVLWRWAATVEPRYTFSRPHWEARPYIAGRVSWQSLDAEDGAGLATEKGWSFGGGGGIAFPLGFGIRADVSARASWLTVDVDGFEDVDRSGVLFETGAALRF